MTANDDGIVCVFVCVCVSVCVDAARGTLWHLCAGRAHSAAGDLDVEAPLGVLLPAERRVVVGLAACLPVTERLIDGLEDAWASTKWGHCLAHRSRHTP